MHQSALRLARVVACFATVLALGVAQSPAGPSPFDQRGLQPAPTVAAGAKNDASRLSQALSEKLSLRRWTLQRPQLPARRAGWWSVPVVLGEEMVTLMVQPRSVRRADAVLLVVGADGVARPEPLPPEQSYGGLIAGRPGSQVAISFVAGSARMFIRTPEGRMWYVQSVAEADGALDPALYVSYAAEDVIWQGHRCGGALKPPGNVPDQLGQELPQPDGPNLCNRQTDIAWDADFMFYQQNGSSVPNAVADIDSIVSGMNLIYVRDANLTFQTGTTIVRTTGDLYASSSINTLLDSLRTEWTTTQAAVVRDVAHLMTGQPTGGVIGLAYVGVVCNSSFQYGVSQSRFTTNMAGRIAVTAHEVGHNFSAPHCDGDADCYIMCSGIGGCSGDLTKFGRRSVAAIRSHASTRSCLSAIAGWPSPLGPRAVDDEVTAGAGAVSIDVLANDGEPNCQTITIQSFTATSVRGGTVTRLAGAGTGGRDLLRYTPPAPASLFFGSDSFSYTVVDPDLTTNTGQVRITSTNLRSPDNAGFTAPGLDGAYYKLPGGDEMPDLAPLTPVSTATVGTINYASASANVVGSGLATNLCASFTGTLIVPTAGAWTFFTESDDGSTLAIDGTIVVANDFSQGMTERSGLVTLTAGPHTVRVEYRNGGGPGGLIVRWQGPPPSGIAKQVIPAGRFAAPGISARYYNAPTALSALPDFTNRTAYTRAVTPDVNFASITGNFAASGRANYVGAVFTGYFVAPAQGAYTFFTESDDGSRLLIGSDVIVSNDGLHGMVERSGTINLLPGKHAIRIEVFQGTGGVGLIARYQGPSITKAVIPAASLVRSVAACNAADISGIGGPPTLPDGILTGDDFNAFINAFASGSLVADITGVGGPPTLPDGAITGDDFIAFSNAFAAGCP